MTGNTVDARTVVDPRSADGSGVAHADTLLAFADAMVGRDDAALAGARTAVIEQLGPEQLVDAAAVASNFERMVRIADATGIPLDAPLDAISVGLRAEIGIDAFGSAANTPRVSAPRRWLGRALAPLARYLMPALAALSRRTAGRVRQPPESS